MESNNLRDKIADFVWRREQTPIEGAQQADPDRQGILSRLAGEIKERWDTSKMTNIRQPDGQIQTTSRSGRILNQETGQFEEPEIRFSTQTEKQFKLQDDKMEAKRKFNEAYQKITGAFRNTNQTASVGNAVQGAVESPQEAQAGEPIKEEVINITFTPEQEAILSREPIYGFDNKKVTPQELWAPLIRSSQHTGFSLQQIRAQFGGESGETWDPQITGKDGEIGISQLMPSAIEEITKKRGRHGSFWEQNFENEFGEFNINNPTHQILGASIYLNWLRNDALPEKGIKNPTDEQVAVAFNGMDTVLELHYGRPDTKLKNGKTVQKQWDDYTDMLRRHGWYDE